jgi:hypothetical protein
LQQAQAHEAGTDYRYPVPDVEWGATQALHDAAERFPQRVVGGYARRDDHDVVRVGQRVLAVGVFNSAGGEVTDGHVRDARSHGGDLTDGLVPQECGFVGGPVLPDGQFAGADPDALDAQ